MPRALAAQVRLKPASGEPLAPRFDKDDKAEELSSVQFPAPLPENTAFTIELPAGLKDDAGRALANAASFPLKVATGDVPPMAKFAGAPFGIVEREAARRRAAADAAPRAGRPAARRGRRPGACAAPDAATPTCSPGSRSCAGTTRRSSRRKELGLPEREWFDTVEERDAKGRVVKRKVERVVATREVPLLAGDAQAKRLDLPQLPVASRGRSR